MNTRFNLSAGPHVRDRWTTAHIMRLVLLAMLPATVVGCVVFGVHALLIVLSSVTSAVLTELLFDKLTGRPDTWKDGSAAVTGLMLALTLSGTVRRCTSRFLAPSSPFWWSNARSAAWAKTSSTPPWQPDASF